MGNSKSVFTDDELEQYELVTYLRKNEILAVYSLFRNVSPEKVDSDHQVRLPIADIINSIPELRENPFSDRLCRIFSSGKVRQSETDRGDEPSQAESMSFDDLLDMYSVLSHRAPTNVKAQFAFRMFDFDNDGILSPQDVRSVVSTLLGKETEPLSEQDMQLLVSNLFKEADLDGDSQLSAAEFEHAMSKVADFGSTFRIRLT